MNAMNNISEVNTAPATRQASAAQDVLKTDEQKADAFFNESIFDAEAASFSHKHLTDHMAYQEGMEVLDSTLLDEVIAARDGYDYNRYTEADVRRALAHEQRTPADFAALLSPAALPLLE